jgi:hypothetical protein
VSTTDPDATPMRLGSGGQTKLGYQAHYVVDGGRARVILNVLVTPSEVSENRPMLDLLWRTAFRWGLRPHQVTGDAKYGTRQNVPALEKAGIRAYVAIPNFDFRHTGLFGTGHFRYDPEKDLYVCPADEHLHRHARTSGDRGTRYRAKLQACNACELKKRCTDSEKGRIIYRRSDEDYYERVRAYRGSFPYEKALRKRRVWVEPLFAEAKDWHGIRRLRLRRLEKVNMEALLIARARTSSDCSPSETADRRSRHRQQPCTRRAPPSMRSGALGSIVRTALGGQRRHFFNTLGRFWYRRHRTS